MEIHEQPFVSLARTGVVAPSAAAGHDVSFLDLYFRDGAEVVRANDVGDTRQEATGFLLAQLRGLVGDLQCFVGRRRIGTAHTRTRQ